MEKELDLIKIKQEAQNCIDRWNKKEEYGYDPDDDCFGIEMTDSLRVSKILIRLCELIKNQKLEIQK